MDGTRRGAEEGLAEESKAFEARYREHQAKAQADALGQLEKAGVQKTTVPPELDKAVDDAGNLLLRKLTGQYHSGELLAAVEKVLAEKPATR